MLSISQFSKASQIPTKTLRYYHQINLLKPAKIDPENQYRYYEIAQLQEAVLIHYLKRYDASLTEIQQILVAPHKLLPLLENKQQELTNKINRYQKFQTQLATEIRALTKGGNFLPYQEKIEIVEIPPCHLLSIRKTINLKNFDQMFQALAALIEEEKVVPLSAPIAIYHSDKYTPENYDLELAIVVPAISSNRQQPAYRAAKLDFVGNYQELPAVYSALSQWLADHELQLIDAPFEFYESDPSQTEPDENQVIVYFPFEKIV